MREGALAKVPTEDNLQPLAATQMASSASQPSHPASCLSLLLQPLAIRGTALFQRHRDRADAQHCSAYPLERECRDMSPPPRKHFGAGPHPQGCGPPCSLVLAALGNALLLPARILWEQRSDLPVSFIRCFAHQCPLCLPSWLS